jgi:hypothetical protein
MGGVEILNHFDARPTVLCNLIDIGPLHEPHTNVGVPQAVGRARVAFAVQLKLCATKNTVEQLEVIAREYRIGQLWIFRFKLDAILLCRLPCVGVSRSRKRS